MFDGLLIEHCSPTLAGLKTANLFGLACPDGQDITAHVCQWDAQLRVRGVQCRQLYRNSGRALVLVYRPNRMAADLQRPEVASFLSQLGYGSNDLDEALLHLSRRIAQVGDFPHEIGLFLGYPLHDVTGFIENEGLNCLCCGCWKVYENEQEAQKLFNQFQKCRRVYKRQFEAGKSVLQLTLAVTI